MMKKSTLLVVFAALAFAISFTSCKKKVHKVNEDYIGYWQGETDSKIYSFDIADDSKTTYREESGFSYVSITKNLRINNDKMRLGNLKRFTVDIHPTATDSGNVWMMEIDGVTYYSEK